MQWVSEGRRVLGRGSKKGLSRRHLEGGNTPFREYDPLGVRTMRCHSEIGMSYSENQFLDSQLLRQYPATLREIQEWPFHSESGFPEIGVVPRLLNSI